MTDADIIRDIQTHIDFWTSYKNIFANVKILDPACGSGAFLNAVFDFMLEHGNMISDKLRRLGVIDASYRWDTHILKHNLYGVDIKNESVEITALSLWLKTVMHKEKLTYLGDNIKCGNSLIDDKNIAGDLAFDWHSEFADIMKNGGFDIVIGNPPYVALQSDNGRLASLLEGQNFKTFDRQGDIYMLFYEQAYNLMNDNGYLGFITSNKWMRAGYGYSLRQFLIEHTKPILLIDLGANIFDSATVDSNMLFLQKKTDNTNITHIKAALVARKNNKTDMSNLTELIDNNLMTIPITADSWIIADTNEQNLKQKLEQVGTPLKDWDIEINRGILTGYNEAFIIDTNLKNGLCKADPKSADILKPILRGRDIKKWHADWQGLWLINAHNGYKDTPAIDIEKDYPAIYQYLLQFKEKLQNRTDKGKDWTNLRSCAYLDNFTQEKIIYPNMTKYLPFIYDRKSILANQKCFILTGQNLKYLITVFNSSVVKHWIKHNCPELQGGTHELSYIFMQNLPIPKISVDDQAPFVEKCNIMLEQHEKLQKLNTSFMMTLESRLSLKNKTEILQKWYGLTYSEFIAELKKQKINIVLKSEREWQEYFTEQKNDALEIVRLIEQTDTDIDNMVYKIYGLNDAEIQIITSV